MTDRRPTDLELATALRAHLPTSARADLRERVALGVGATGQQRAWPSVAGALNDADPLTRRRNLMVAAAALLSLALLGAIAAGATRWWERTDGIPGAGATYAFVRDGDLFVATADGGEAVLVAHVDGTELTDPQWSADGRWLAVQTEEPAILGFDVLSGRLQRLADGTIGAWSPTASRLAYFTPTGEIALVQPETGETRVLVAPPPGSDGWPGYASTLVWSPDGTQIATTGLIAAGPFDESHLVRIDATSGAVTSIVTSDACCAFRPSWSPDGDRIAYSIWFERGSPPGFWVSTVDGQNTMEIRDPDGGATDPSWSPNGKWIAYHANDWVGEQRSISLAVVHPDGSDRRVLASNLGELPDKLDFGAILGWTGDSGAIAYELPSRAGETESHEIHLVTLSDGSDRVLSIPQDGRDYAWTLATSGDPEQPIHPPSSASEASLPPAPTAVAPAASDAVVPDASWGGLAYRIQRGEGDCYVAVQRFALPPTVIDPPAGPPPTEAPETPEEPGAGATAGPQPASEYCDIGFSPDGLAYAITSQAYQSTTIVGTNGIILGSPLPWGGLPSWSPRGTWIALQSCDAADGCGGNWVIMRRDGTDRRELPGEPRWSLDEGTMAVRGDDGQLLVGRGAGTDLRPIGDFPLPGSWAPDGARFVFIRDGNAWVAGANGDEVRAVTGFDLGGVTGAWWSPDGDWIAIRQGTTMWAFTPDGTTRQRLGAGLGGGSWSGDEGWAPAWSPDGAWVAFEHDVPSAEPDSTTPTVTMFHAGDWRAIRLTNAWQPVWSADGQHLAVMSSDADGWYGVDVMAADGTGRTTIARDVAYPPISWVP